MSLWTDWTTRIRSLLLQRQEERELDEELRTHIAMEVEHRERNGASAAEARRASHLAFGGVEQVKEQMRDASGARPLQDLNRDVSYTLRSLARRPGFALVTILTLAVGIGGTTAVFSAVDTVLLQPLPYQEPGQLVRVYQPYKQNPGNRLWLTPVHFLAYREESSAFEGLAAIQNYSQTGADIGTGDAAQRIRLLEVSADYFDVLRVPPAVGSGFTRDQENGASSVVISDRIWADNFGRSASVVGQPIVMNGHAFTVAGVMPAGYADPVVGNVDAFIPLNLTAGRDPSNSNNHYLTAIGRLRPGQSIAQAQAEMDALSRRLAEQYPDAKDAIAQLYPLKDDIVGSSSRGLELMLGGVALVLLLVCVNVANLMLVRGSERAREFALRSALGAERSRLVRQLLIESLTLALVGAVAGLVIAQLGMAALVHLAAGNIPRLDALALNGRLMLFAVAVATVSAVIFGLAPALRAARTQPGDVLRDQSRSSTGGIGQLRLREWLVISQVSLAFILLAGAGLLLASFRKLQEVDLGIQPAQVQTFEVHLPDARYDAPARARFYDALANRLATLPGVKAAGSVSRLPGTGSYHTWGVQAVTGPLIGTDRQNTEAEQRVIAGDYFTAVGIPLLRGRQFDERDDATAPDRVIISEELAERLFPKTDPLGQRLRTGGREGEIIGVVGNTALDNEGAGAFWVYHPHRAWATDRNWSLTQVISTPGGAPTLLNGARQILKEMDPGLVLYRPATLEDVIGRGIAQRVFTMQVLLAFAGVAVALSALGIFGVLSYGVRLRARDSVSAWRWAPSRGPSAVWS
jgi:predicted permease